ncbi:hypothetical protein [Aeromicrobium sp. 9AM]|uniref:hypothetical protein n=1 Tax=Aeromicrobium sp. 9AM TaxID=2653126 RepID=UPI0012F24909|nr:hypothetical protein [Aeromicrobium sp. 9AM]VXC34218.1 conserved membrane hypothetical protein [Aeromicrobium sp. 9AM]
MNSTTTHTVTATTSPVSLRTALLLDATITGANALAYVAGATVLDSLLGPSPGHFVAIGAFLAVCAAILAVTGTRRPIPRGWAMFAAEVNIAWAVGSVAVVAFGWFDLTSTGQVWTIMQAALVAAFAALQLTALRRTP